MHKQGVAEFPFYCGINSLSELAVKEDRVVVLNILGFLWIKKIMDIDI